MIQKAKEFTTRTYISRFVARSFQRMIRAEYAACETPCAAAMVKGSLEYIPREYGECVCVTCGSVKRWNHKGMHTGHFLASRRNSILFEEANVAPQCAYCNQFLHGYPESYRMWMLAIHPEGTIERLEQLKTTSVSFTREELVDMRIRYDVRLKAAEQLMKQPSQGASR